MSSHREAPEISKDPVADSTDVYAFVSPDRPDSVTLIANYIPLEAAAAGPNFYEFGEDVLYQIHVSHGHSVRADVTFTFAFTTEVLDRETFLYNTGQIKSLHDKTFNRRQFYTVSRTDHRGTKVLARHLASRRATSARGLSPTTRPSPRPPCTTCGADGECSPVSGLTRSTSTSDRCSTCSTCGRSRTFT